MHEPFLYVSLHNPIRTVLQVKKPMLYSKSQELYEVERMIQGTVCGKSVSCEMRFGVKLTVERSKQGMGWILYCTVIRDAYSVRLRNALISFENKYIEHTFICLQKLSGITHRLLNKVSS